MAATMYDSINPASIPSGVNAAGYVDGGWPWAAQPGAGARFSSLLTITVAGNDADAADIETTDMTPAMAGPWARGQVGRGRQLPLKLYCNRENGPAVEASLDASGFTPGDGKVALWIATLDGTQVVARWGNGAPVRYPVWGVQYAGSRITGQNYDLTIVYGELAGGGSGQITEDDTMLYRGPIHPLAARLTAYAAGSYYKEPFAALPAAGAVTKGAVYGVDGYCYSSTPVQATVPPEADSLWWHASTGGWVPDALLDTSALAGAPGAAFPGAEPVVALFDASSNRYIPLATAQADDDSAFVTKAAIKAAIGTL